jgi:hypothetical protein
VPLDAAGIDRLAAAMSSAGQRAIDNFLKRPITYMGVPIVWDTFEEPQVPAKTDRLLRWYGADFATPNKPVKKDYNTVGVRFIHGHNLEKVYTYKVRKGAKLHLGQMVVVESNLPTGWTKSLAAVVRIDKKPTDTGPFNYLFITETVKDL